MSASRLTIDGHVTTPATLNHSDLSTLPATALIDDVSTLDPHRSGKAVTLAGLLSAAAPTDAATHITLHSDDGFSASLAIESVCDLGVIIYEQDGSPLNRRFGGPFRFLIPNAAACKTAELDACANVKHLNRIELSAGVGRDTR